MERAAEHTREEERDMGDMAACTLQMLLVLRRWGGGGMTEKRGNRGKAFIGREEEVGCMHLVELVVLATLFLTCVSELCSVQFSK